MTFTEHQTTNRVKNLRKRMNHDEHGCHRIELPDNWSVADMKCSLTQRRSYALYMACNRMPIAIEPDELIVGLRTLSLLPETLHSNETESISSLSISHNVPGFGKVIKHGLGELANKAKANLAIQVDKTKREYLESFIIACEATGLLLKRYSNLAQCMVEQTKNSQRRADLTKIARTCDHLILGAPRDLHEALQLYWLTWNLIVLEVGYLVSMGRIDQVLVNYWPTNPAKQASAQELIDCFVIKCNDYNKLWQGTSAINNQVMLSGLTRDGLDATNAVSWSMLSALDRLNMPNPQIAVRLHDNSPPDLLHEVCRLWQEGRSQIAIYNDDVFVPALQGAGIDASDARDYAIDACQDVLIFGKSDFFMAGIIGMTDILIQTMSTASDRASWQTFLSDYKKKLANSVTNVCNIYNEKIHPAPNLPAPLLSVSLDNCIETALDFGNGGLAICDKGIILAQPVTMINSLAALRTVVYEQGTATLSEVCKACNNNWVGYEELRRKLWNAPKWGNDDDNVDFLGADIFRFTSEEIWKHRLPNGSRFLSGIHQAHHIGSGSRLNATPDGRRKGEAIPPGLSPANGTANCGPTAVMKSVTKIDPMIVQWNSSLSMQFLPSCLCNGQGLMKFERLIRTWLKLRGPQLQVNVVSRETLELAQADPDNYRDLIVRVWGFCDRFVSLPTEYQDELIERTQYNV